MKRKKSNKNCMFNGHECIKANIIYYIYCKNDNIPNYMRWKKMKRNKNIDNKWNE